MGLETKPGPVRAASHGSMHGLLIAIVWVEAKVHLLHWVFTLGLQSSIRTVSVTAELPGSGTFITWLQKTC